MQAGGQSILDRLLAAKNTIAGQAVAKVVCKATTEEAAPPKRKHLDFLLHATHQANVSIPDIADLLIERSQNSSWIVAFKSLITIHHLMSNGNERFESYMASHNYHLQALSLLDRVGLSGSEMLIYMGRYADYLNEKREAYKIMGYDFCKLERRKDDGLVRTMSIDKLWKVLPIIQKQIDPILRFDVSPNELTNGIIYSCFFLLFKDLLHLYAIYNDGIINLLEKYFNTNKKQCREALDMYKKFLDRTDQISQYFKKSERYEQLFDRYFWEPPPGVDRGDIAALIRDIENSKAPIDLLESLENHLASIEGKKILSPLTISKSPTQQDTKNFSRGFADNFTDSPQQVIKEEAKALEKFSSQKELLSPSPISTQTKVTSNENLLDITDIFSQQQSSNEKQQQTHEKLFTDDLFSLDVSASETSTNTCPIFSNVSNVSTSHPTSLFDILEPTSASTTKTTYTVPLITSSPTSNTSTVTKPFQSSDLNSSLNQLIDHLDIHDHTKIGKDHLWTTEDIKNRQIISSISVTTHSPGMVWSQSATINSSSNTIMTQADTAWPQPSSTSLSNNPFVPPNGSMEMSFNSRPTNLNTNPFASQPLTNITTSNQEQIFNPFK